MEIKKITLRDYFAAMTMNASISNTVTSVVFAQLPPDQIEATIAKAAYKMADAMIKQRDE